MIRGYYGAVVYNGNLLMEEDATTRTKACMNYAMRYARSRRFTVDAASIHEALSVVHLGNTSYHSVEKQLHVVTEIIMELSNMLFYDECMENIFDQDGNITDYGTKKIGASLCKIEEKLLVTFPEMKKLYRQDLLDQLHRIDSKFSLIDFIDKMAQLQKSLSIAFEGLYDEAANVTNTLRAILKDVNAGIPVEVTYRESIDSLIFTKPAFTKVKCVNFETVRPLFKNHGIDALTACVDIRGRGELESFATILPRIDDEERCEELEKIIRSILSEEVYNFRLRIFGGF